MSRPIEAISPIAPIEPIEPSDPIVTKPAAVQVVSQQPLHEPLPLEEIAAEAEPVEELSPLDIDEALLPPEEPAEPIAAKESAPPTAPATPPILSAPIPIADVVVDLGEHKLDETDLVALATDDAEPMSMESAPHDTAHIPLAVSPFHSTAETPIESAEVPQEQNAVVDGSVQTPVGSIDLSADPEPMSAADLSPTENYSDEIPVAETMPQHSDADANISSAVTDDSAAAEDGLELLDESGIPPFTPSLPEPYAADVADAIDDTDLPRRGWRSGIAEPAEAPSLPPPLINEPDQSAAPQNTNEEPAAEAELAAPQSIDEADIAQPSVAEPQIDEPKAAEADLSEPEAAALDFAAPEFTRPKVKVAEPEPTRDATEPEIAPTEFP